LDAFTPTREFRPELWLACAVKHIKLAVYSPRHIVRVDRTQRREQFLQTQMHSEEMSEFELVALGKSNSHTSPLFCLPGAGGELWVFRQVASLIADDQP